MITFDLEKYKVPVEIVNGKNKVRCLVRKSYLHLTPEEIIRQAFINYLILEKRFPVDKIHIEVPLSRFEKGIKERADIIIYDMNNVPLMVYECKHANVDLTDEVLAQGNKYFGYIDTLVYLGFI